jgi:hypothetical protein
MIQNKNVLSKNVYFFSKYFQMTKVTIVSNLNFDKFTFKLVIIGLP